MLDVFANCLETYWQYYALLLYIIVGYVIINNVVMYNKKLYWTITTYVVIVLLHGLRGKYTGTDTHNYLEKFYNIGNMNYSNFTWKTDGVEIGYAFINKIFFEIGFESDTFLLLESIFIFFTIGFFFYKYSKNVFISTVLLVGLPCFIISLNILRVFVAISFVFWSIHFLINKKNKYALLLAICSICIHQTMLIYLMILCMYPFNKMKMYIIFLGVLFFIFLLKYFILVNISDILIAIQYDNYLEHDEYISGIAQVSLMQYIVYFTLVLSAWIIMNYINENNNDIYKNVTNISVISYLIVIIASMLSYDVYAISRIKYMFYPMICILIPNIIEEFRPFYKIGCYCFVIIFSFIYMTLILSGDFTGSLIYKLGV